MSPRPPLPRKVGGHDPPAPMGAPPLMQCISVACPTARRAVSIWLSVCLSVTFVYCVETGKRTAIVAMECE